MEFNPFKRKISELNTLEAKQGNALLSEPFLLDPYFQRAVVLIAENNEKGTVGFVLNNPLDLKVQDLITDFPEFKSPVYLGGPVEAQNLFFIHNKPQLIPGSMHIKDSIYWNGDFEILKSLIRKKLIQENDLRLSLIHISEPTRRS